MNLVGSRMVSVSEIVIGGALAVIVLTQLVHPGGSSTKQAKPSPSQGEVVASQIDPDIARWVQPTNGWTIQCDGVDWYFVAGTVDGRAAFYAGGARDPVGQVLQGPANETAFLVDGVDCGAVHLMTGSGARYDFVLDTRRLVPR